MPLMIPLRVHVLSAWQVLQPHGNPSHADARAMAGRLIFTSEEKRMVLYPPHQWWSVSRMEPQEGIKKVFNQVSKWLERLQQELAQYLQQSKRQDQVHQGYRHKSRQKKRTHQVSQISKYCKISPPQKKNPAE